MWTPTKNENAKPLFKSDEEFLEGKSRALNLLLILNNGTGHTPSKPALLPGAEILKNGGPDPLLSIPNCECEDEKEVGGEAP